MINVLFFSIPYKIPVVNGIDIDLYLLYSLVLQRGGLSKVSEIFVLLDFLRQLFVFIVKKV